MKVFTQNASGRLAALEYHEAQWRAEEGWLLVTHIDQKNGTKMLSRVPLANVVQIIEEMPNKTDT